MAYAWVIPTKLILELGGSSIESGPLHLNKYFLFEELLFLNLPLTSLNLTTIHLHIYMHLFGAGCSSTPVM